MSDTSAMQRATRWLHELERALAAGSVSSAVSLFGSECFWRDMVAFTWNIKTMEGKDQIAAFLSATLAEVQPRSFRIEGEARETDGVIEARFTFETKLARGRGVLRLKGDKGWTILTVASALKGFEEKCGSAREKGVVHGVHKNRQTWLERKTEEEASLGAGRQPYCLVIGGGQGGMALGARLKRLGVPTIIVTLGSEGCFVSEPHRHFFIAAHRGLQERTRHWDARAGEIRQAIESRLEREKPAAA